MKRYTFLNTCLSVWIKDVHFVIKDEMISNLMENTVGKLDQSKLSVELTALRKLVNELQQTINDLNRSLRIAKEKNRKTPT